MLSSFSYIFSYRIPSLSFSPVNCPSNIVCPTPSRNAETLLARQLAVWRNFPTQSSMISERVIKIQTDPSDPLCNIGRTLANRVETSHDSVAMAMMNEQRDRERQTAQTGQVGAVGVMGYSIPIEMEGTTRLPFPLRSPSLTESAVFQRQDSTSIISTKWTPVLLCLSSAGFLHMFDIDPKGEQGTDSSAFSNIAGQTKKGVELEIFTIVADGAAVASAETSTAKIMQLDTQSLNNILVTENFMMPAVSLSVPRCTVQFTPTANDFVFEIIESTPNTGIESLFRSMTERR